MPCKCSYTMCNFQWMGCERAKYAGFSAVEVSEKQFGNFTGLSAGSRSCVHKMHFSRGICTWAIVVLVEKSPRIVLKIAVHQMLPMISMSILDLAPTWCCSMWSNCHCRNTCGTIPEVLSFSQKRKLQFLLLQKRLCTEFWPSLWSHGNAFLSAIMKCLLFGDTIECLEQNSVVGSAEAAWTSLFIPCLASPQRYEVQLLQWRGCEAVEVLWFVHFRLCKVISTDCIPRTHRTVVLFNVIKLPL